MAGLLSCCHWHSKATATAAAAASAASRKVCTAGGQPNDQLPKHDAASKPTRGDGGWRYNVAAEAGQ